MAVSQENLVEKFRIELSDAFKSFQIELKERFKPLDDETPVSSSKRLLELQSELFAEYIAPVFSVFTVNIINTSIRETLIASNGVIFEKEDYFLEPPSNVVGNFSPPFGTQNTSGLPPKRNNG